MIAFGPVTQTVRHHLQYTRMAKVKRVAGAGIVDAIAAIILYQAIIRRVVEPAKVEGRAQFAAFRGVVVDHVEQHLDSGSMEAANGNAQIVRAAAAHVATFGREERERIIAPVIDQTQFLQSPVLHEFVDRQ